ncbi:MAG: Fic family protein [Natronincolaceae bacterium]|jgi:Fic family protein|nr:Fic family protein [Bacillota bacterium]
MLYFHKEYYNLKTLNDRKNRSRERMNYDSTIKTNLEVKPINQPETFTLYYVPTNDTIELISEISRLDILLENSYNDLPGLAQKMFFVDMLSMELQSSNELEGVRSSKDEIVQTTKRILDEGKDKKIEARFINVIKSYLELKDGNLRPPVNSKDCRKIYDEITAGEISKDNSPDGKYFRNDITYVQKGGRIIHRGIFKGEDTEKIIIEKMNDIFEFMDARECFKLHKLIKIAIAHYYFGYIHPFYDGNGRTGRFIGSIYLKEGYSWLTAMSLSQGCNRERNRYLKAFDITNQISSQGEVNFFVDEFLSVMLEGQREILGNLVQKSDLLGGIMSKIENDDGLKNEDEKNIMGIMAQEYHFNPLSEGIGVSDLRAVFDYTDETIRVKLKGLFDRGFTEKIKGRPVKYLMSGDYLEN